MMDMSSSVFKGGQDGIVDIRVVCVTVYECECECECECGRQDRMLDMGFEPQMKQIFSKLPSSSKRQTVMFTATWPKCIAPRKF